MFMNALAMNIGMITTSSNSIIFVLETLHWGGHYPVLAPQIRIEHLQHTVSCEK